MSFAFGYPHQFRYFRSCLIEDNIDRIREILPKLTDTQRENVVSLLNVELVVNAVMYCEDLAIMLLALEKPITKMIKTFAAIRETGSGSVKEFYEKMPERQIEYFWHIIKYDKFYEKDTKYVRSCKRFARDILKVSKFFMHWYPLFCAFKHGLNVLSYIDKKSGKDILIVGALDGTFTITLLPPTWSIAYIEIIEIIHRIFDKIVDPLTWVILEEVTGINVKGKENLEAFVKSKEPIEKSRSNKFSLELEFPWKIHTGEERKPFY
ncbi:MAG: hypothetical protein D4S01_03390 [Dehalococcoidia bacterium]|nr:MAG: hypothetical protein D4S01_03390 [Dehalococcoidia bacterium]